MTPEEMVDEYRQLQADWNELRELTNGFVGLLNDGCGLAFDAGRRIAELERETGFRRRDIAAEALLDARRHAEWSRRSPGFEEPPVVPVFPPADRGFGDP